MAVCLCVVFHLRLLHLYVSRSVLVRCFFRSTPQKVLLLMLYFDIDPKNTNMHTHTHNLTDMLLDILCKRLCGSMFDEIEKHTHTHTLHTHCIYV